MTISYICVTTVLVGSLSFFQQKGGGGVLLPFLIFNMKKCKVCKASFVPKYSTTQQVCSLGCSVAYLEDKKKKQKKESAKAWVKEKRTIKQRLKTHSDHLKDLQRIFNRYIRLRDKDEPCISCKTTVSEVWDAGHFRAVGSHPELRFEELNVHKQCRKCNGYWGGNLIDYRINLIDKIGLLKVEWLEGKHKPTKLTIPEIESLKKLYLNKIKETK